MENRQSVQHQRSQGEKPTPDMLKMKSGTRASWQFLLHLIVHYPWLVFVGLLVVFVGSAAFSLYSMGYVEQVEQQETQASSVEVTQPITPPETSKPIPLWIVAAIALSCGSGCIVILRILNRPRQYQSVKKHLNRHRYQTRSTQSEPPTSETIPAEPPAKEPPVFTLSQPAKEQANNLPVFLPQPAWMQNPKVFVPPSQRPQSVLPILPNTEPSITVVPPEESHPLDTGKEPLADMLDIRKQTSLSTILQNKSIVNSQ